MSINFHLFSILFYSFIILSLSSATDLTSSESFRLALGTASEPFSLRPNITHDFPCSGPCREFTDHGMLYPNKNNKLVVRHVESAGILYARWSGHSPVNIHFPFDRKCEHGRYTSRVERRSNVSIESMLCTYDRASKFSDRSTVIMQMQSSLTTFRDIVDDLGNGLNVWTLHANIMPIWAGLRQINITSSLLPDFNVSVQDGRVFPEPLKHTLDIVMLFPEELWHLFSRHREPLLVTEKNSREALNHGCHSSTLIGLQTLRDALSPNSKIIVANYTTSLSTIRNALVEGKMNTRAEAWYVPPGINGMLWFLKRSLVVGYMGDCIDSLVQEYANHMLRSLNNPNRAALAKHVCLLSRQKREKAEIGRQMFLSRNLEREIYRKLVSSLGTVLVLNPNLGVIDPEVRETGLVTKIARTGVLDQMQFVNEKCAVLFGVHGAGFAHTLALRPGTHVLEIHAAFEPNTYRNSAAMMNNITYTMIRFNSTVLDRERYFEVNLTIPNGVTVDDVVEVVNEKLDDSIRRQELLIS